MYIDKHITWEQQIKHVKAKISKNTGIINKLRYRLDLNMLNLSNSTIPQFTLL
jgi:flagellin-specific chaperone FliS